MHILQIPHENGSQTRLCIGCLEAFFEIGAALIVLGYEPTGLVWRDAPARDADELTRVQAIMAEVKAHLKETA